MWHENPEDHPLHVFLLIKFCVSALVMIHVHKVFDFRSHLFNLQDEQTHTDKTVLCQGSLI